MIDCSVRLELHPEAEYLASLTRKPTRRYNRRLSLHVKPSQPQPSRTQGNRRMSVDSGMPSTSTGTITAPIDRETALRQLNMQNILQLDLESDDDSINGEAIENDSMMDYAMNVDEDSFVLNEAADNITEATVSNNQDGNVFEDMAHSDELSGLSSQPTDDGLNSTPSVSNDEASTSTVSNITEDIDVDVQSDQSPSTSGSSGSSGGRTNTKWVEVNVENNQNASNLPAFIPFKIRGRRPSENFRTNLQPIFERPESPDA